MWFPFGLHNVCQGLGGNEAHLHMDATIGGIGENWNCKWEFESAVVEVTDFANFFMIIVWSVWVVVTVGLVCY